MTIRSPRALLADQRTPLRRREYEHLKQTDASVDFHSHRLHTRTLRSFERRTKHTSCEILTLCSPPPRYQIVIHIAGRLHVMHTTTMILTIVHCQQCDTNTALDMFAVITCRPSMSARNQRLLATQMAPSSITPKKTESDPEHWQFFKIKGHHTRKHLITIVSRPTWATPGDLSIKLPWWRLIARNLIFIIHVESMRVGSEPYVHDKYY